MKLYEEYELEKYGIKGYDVDISYENPEYSEIFQMPLDEYEELMRKEFDEIVEQQERYFPASIDNG